MKMEAPVVKQRAFACMIGYRVMVQCYVLFSRGQQAGESYNGLRRRIRRRELAQTATRKSKRRAVYSPSGVPRKAARDVLFDSNPAKPNVKVEACADGRGPAPPLQRRRCHTLVAVTLSWPGHVLYSAFRFLWRPWRIP